MKIKKLICYFLAAVLLLGLSALTACEPAPPSIPDPDISIKGMVVTFQDEFNGPTVDKNKWNFQLGSGSQGPHNAWGNQEQQYYKEENAIVKNGVMLMVGRKEETIEHWERCDCEDKDHIRRFTSARLTTAKKFKQTYGRFEAKIKLPAVNGMWPAFWMMPDDSVYGGWPRSGELDIMEARGRIPEQVGQAIHFGAGTRSQHAMIYKKDNYTLADEGRIDEYHVYRVDWHPDSIEWFIDGESVYKVLSERWSTSQGNDWSYGNYVSGNERAGENTAQISNPGRPAAPFDRDFHMILNLAIGGHFDNFVEPPDDFYEEYMEVDYVRAWQFEDYLYGYDFPEYNPDDSPSIQPFSQK